MKHKIIEKKDIIDYFNPDNSLEHDGYPFVSSAWSAYVKNNFLSEPFEESLVIYVFQFESGIGHNVNKTELENKAGVITTIKDIPEKSFSETRVYHVLD